MKALFAMMAGYNKWANTRLYEAADALSQDRYHEDRGAFFSSLNGTLNHLLVADRIWMRRLTGSGPQPSALNEILHEDLRELKAARIAEDERIIAYVRDLSDDALSGQIRYRRMTRPEEVCQPLAPLLAHLFNHQTHHRGQAHCLLTQLAGDAPSLDLLVYQAETGIGMT